MERLERKKMRLEGFDYASCGAYFITVCTKERKPLLWADVGANCVRPGAAVELSKLGRIVEAEIANLDAAYPEVQVDHFCIMPNHVHFLLMIQPAADGRTQFAPTISRVVKQFKGSVTKKAGFPLWQKSFYDHIVRNRESYLDIWRYINENPLKWQLDSLCKWEE